MGRKGLSGVLDYKIRYSKPLKAWVIDGPEGTLRTAKTFIITFDTEQWAQDHCDALNSGGIVLR